MLHFWPGLKPKKYKTLSFDTARKGSVYKSQNNETTYEIKIFRDNVEIDSFEINDIINNVTVSLDKEESESSVIKIMYVVYRDENTTSYNKEPIYFYNAVYSR